jgi:hypothetical protein
MIPAMPGDETVERGAMPQRADETVVTVVDLEPTGEEGGGPGAEAAAVGPHGPLEGGLFLLVGLVTLVVERLAQVLVAVLGADPPPSETIDLEMQADTEADAVATSAVIAGAGLDVALRATRSLTRMVAGLDRALRPLSLVAMIPLVDRMARRLETSASRMNDSWRAERAESQRVMEAVADRVVPSLTEAVLDRLDLTQLVLERVDLDDLIGRVDVALIVKRVEPMSIVDRLDVDSVAARLDVQGIVDRLDLVAIARGVIDELDLPEIIRGSTETMAAETRDGVRVQGMRADRFVSRLVDRALLRQNGGTERSPGDAPGSTEDPP